MRVHFIAIGGAVMHNLAIALYKKGYEVTGSDDEIFEPSRSRLEAYGLLPARQGWYPSAITPGIDTVILGMHAREDNPELIRARELGLVIKSFPEYLYEQTRDKKRIVVSGSHGKTTTTAMIMHVFRHCGLNFDYMVGSSIDGFDTMVGLSEKSEISVFEGDEYLTSPIDRRPKFHLYKPDIAVITGIAWDHMNVFPTFENYIEQFRIFAGTITQGGHLVYFSDDPELQKIAGELRPDIIKTSYTTHGYFQNNKGFFGATLSRVFPLQIFGEHNMQNLSAAREVCLLSGISEDRFCDAMQSFPGTSKRLQKMAENGNVVVYLDFAHAPSKVKATINAVAERYPDREIITCLELHTYSSLNSEFLPRYKGTLDKASKAFVYFNPHAAELKKLRRMTKTEVSEAFENKNVKVYDNAQELFSDIFSLKIQAAVYLLMSSGDFDGCDIKKLSSELSSNK